MSRQEFSVAIGFGAGPSFDSDKGLLMSRQSFYRGGGGGGGGGGGDIPVMIEDFMSR